MLFRTLSPRLFTLIAEYTPWKHTHHGRPFLRMEIREVFAQNLKKYRRAAGISQEELAHRAGIDRTYVSLLERRIYSATIDILGKLADALEIEPHLLLKRPTRK